MKIKFREAWKIWRSGGKTITGETITIWTLLILAMSGIVETTASFFTEKFWVWIWNRKKKKD